MKIIIMLTLFLSLIQADFIRDDTKEVVQDTFSNLMWQDDTNSTTKNLTTSISYCEGLSLGSFTDWRLPNIHELYLLADRSKSNPAISSVFQNIQTNNYWSSTSHNSISGNVWNINFKDGATGIDKSSNYNYVRCVR